MKKTRLLLLLVLLTMLSTRAVAQNDASAMREQMKERLDELKALAPENVKGLNETLKNDTVKVFTAQYTNLYNASPLESYEAYEEAYDFLGYIIDRVNKYLAAYKEFTDNMTKLQTLIQNFNPDTEKKQEYKTFAQNVYNAYKALSEHDMIAITDENVEAQKEYDDNEYNYVPDDVTSENIADVEGRPSEYISTYDQFNAFFIQNTKELGSIYLEVAGTGTAESPENLTYQLRNPNLENAGEQWWGTDWTAFGNSAAEQSGKAFDTYQMVHLPEGYYTLVGYGMDRRGSWEDVLAKDREWRWHQRTDFYALMDFDGNDTTRVEAFKAKDMALTADITNGAGNISTCEVDGVTYYTPNSMAQYRAWEDAKIDMAGQGHAAVVQFWVWQDDFGKLGFVHRWPIDNTWFVADGIQLYYAIDDFPKINIDTPDCASVTITNDGWATLYTDKALAFSGIKGLTAYTAKRDGSTVTLTPVDNVPANTGVVLKGDAKEYNIPIIANSTTDMGELQGSATTATAFDAHAADGGIYVLGLNDKNEAQFEKKTSDNVPAGKPYLLVPTAEEPSSALQVVIAGETTPAATGYSVTLAEGTEDSDNWTISPAEAAEGETVTATYSGERKVKSVKAVKKEAAPAPASITDLATITADYEAKDGETLTGTLGSNVKISIADGATVTLKDVDINGSGTWTSGNYAGITCAGDATITLEGMNTVKGFAEKYPGIFVSSEKTLVINGTGELNASSNTGTGGAGIGGGDQMNCGNIEIQSGTVTAIGNEYGAGIGGGHNANCGDITISGGKVTATGGHRAAGIGGGRRGSSGTKDEYDSGSCGNITISGGTITAKGGEAAAGIGGGRGNTIYYKSSCGTITITSGVTSVTATKGSDDAQSIGAGYLGTCGAVTIENGANVIMASGTDLSTINANYTASDGETLTGTLGANVKISIAAGATVTLDGVSINANGGWTTGDYAGITCEGNATIILNGTNTVTGFDGTYPGIHVPVGSTVTIKGSGSLTASGNGGGAGIGGGWAIPCGNIEIQGGTITAAAGNESAGIGGGNNANCGNITISGGTVTATGGIFAAGIGSGSSSEASCGSITISGGTVTATGGEWAAGIGSGAFESSCGAITITSGVTHVTATKGEEAPNSIGAGDMGSSCGTVSIEDPSKVTQN